MNIYDIAWTIGGGIGGATALWLFWFRDRHMCGCGHALAFHNPETAKCHASVSIVRYDDGGSTRGRELRPCACQQYDGKK